MLGSGVEWMMPGMADDGAFLDPDASREYLRTWKDRIDSMAARTQSMAEQMERLRIKGKDDNGIAEVTIDSSGIMLDLELSDRMQRFQPDVVSRAVLSALQKARVKAAQQTREIAVETMGPDSLSARTIADRMEKLLERPEAENIVLGESSERDNHGPRDPWLGQRGY